MVRRIPYGRQDIDESDIEAVIDVLRGDWLTQGPTIERFEEAVAEKVDARHAVAFSSGTAALHGAAVAAELGADDLVYTSPLSFIASANCARYVGASVGLVDIDPTTLNMDLTAVPTDADAVVAVDYAGLPVRFDQLPARPRVLIEDAAHALGASTLAGPVGNCAASDLCVFSLHPVKPITSGEGGIVTTNDSDLADALRRFRSHGIVAKPERGGWHYEVVSLGFNYRMTDMQAALGLSQLARLDSYIARRNAIAQRYRQLLAGMPIVMPPVAEDGVVHGYHLFPVLVPERRKVYEGLRALGIGVQVHYVPIHHHPISAGDILPPGNLPNCDRVYQQILSLPIYPTLSEDDQDYVVEGLEAVLQFPT